MSKAWIMFFTSLVIFFINGCYMSVAYSDDQNNKIHVTIVGKKDDETAKNLYDTAVKYAPKNSLIQWRNGQKGKSPHSEGEYPDLKKSAAYVCMKNKCSLPAFTPHELQVIIQNFTTSPIILTDKSVPVQDKNFISHNENQIAQMLKTKSLWLIVPIFWFIGLLLAITPCVLPLMLIITSILGGSSEILTKKKAFILSLIYILALATTYAIAGMVVASFGVYLQGYMQNSWVLGSFSLFFILLGISLFGFFNIGLPRRWRKAIDTYSKSQGGGSYIGVALMGIFATLIASPCVAAPLAGILAYVAESGNVKLGGIALFSTGIGIGTPVILVSTVGIGLLQKTGEWQKYVKQFFGILLLGIAIWLLQRILPAKIIMLLWAALTIFTAIYMGALEIQSQYPFSDPASRRPSAKLISVFSKVVSLMLLVYGGAILVGALIGNTNPLAPLARQALTGSVTTVTLSSFHHVKNLPELQQSLTTAQAIHKPAMLIFSAEWCASCQEIEHDVFSDSNVQLLLQKYVLLYADLTDFTSEDVTLAKYFNVIGPPTILFFNSTNLMPIMRIDGAISAPKLSSTLALILNERK